MALRGMLIFVLCSPADANPGLPRSSSGCGPECLGTCIAGSCLFGENQFEDVESLRSPVFPRADGLATVGLPQVPSALTGLEALGMRAPAGFAQQQQFTNTAALASPQMPIVEPPWTSKEQELTIELQRAEAHENALKEQNAQLRQLLEEWKRTGLNIAEREKKAAELLGRPSASFDALSALAAPMPVRSVEPPVAASKTPAVQPSLLQQMKTRSAAFLAAGASRSYLQSAMKMVCIVFAVACFWRFCCFAWSLKKGEIDLRTSMAKAIPTGASGQRLRNMMGLAEYRVEVSDIYLGSLFAGSSDVRVSFRMGNGAERRTRVPKNRDGTFLRFDDILELSLCSSDAPCTLLVSDRRGELAQKDIPAAELVRLANRPHQQYFRTELTACDALDPSCEAPAFSDPQLTPRSVDNAQSRRRPYIAMRLRNIDAPAAATTAAASKAAEQRAYGSFAV